MQLNVFKYASIKHKKCDNNLCFQLLRFKTWPKNTSCRLWNKCLSCIQ